MTLLENRLMGSLQNAVCPPPARLLTAGPICQGPGGWDVST